MTQTLIGRLLIIGSLALASGFARDARADDLLAPQGATPLFNGEDLSGWKGLVADPPKRAQMSEAELREAQKKSDEEIRKHWRAEAGEIINDGSGPHLCTDRDYGDFELWLDWKITSGADSGIYLRGSPQVQIWDPVDGIDQAKVGSGGLYNNQKHPSKPLVVADRPTGEWNSFYIRMIGERVTVRLNGQLVVDDVPLENYWERDRPIYPKGQIELQTHGGEIRFRRLYIREISAEEANRELAHFDETGYRSLFNGRDMTGWQGAVDGYQAANGVLSCERGHGGNLYTKDEFSDFILRFEFRLEAGSNNGLGIRAPLEGDAAYVGMELQILDNSAEKFAHLKPYQYHGSVYGVQPAHRGYQRPVGEWNFQEVVCSGKRVTVRLNGTTIVDVDLGQLEGTADGRPHPGLQRTSGHIGFLGHNDPVAFRNIRLQELD
ncbi:MAG: DUF1080 domain-containing protein [Planctomycetota bacterium]